MNIGIDIVVIKRIETILQKNNTQAKKFLNKILSKKEQKLLKTKINKKAKAQSVAGYWGAKEALSKALGVGIGKKFSFLDCEIKKDKLGKPCLKINKKLKKIFKIKNKDISLSISHDGGFGVSVVVVSGS
jgi:holo-[acyl-carrier protein] synthase